VTRLHAMPRGTRVHIRKAIRGRVADFPGAGVGAVVKTLNSARLVVQIDGGARVTVARTRITLDDASALPVVEDLGAV
jgi:hypothetical protein